MACGPGAQFDCAVLTETLGGLTEQADHRPALYIVLSVSVILCDILIAVEAASNVTV